MGSSLSLPTLKLSILQIIIYILIPLAPLYSRIVDFRGSLDKAWLLYIPFFNFFPFSLVSVLLMAFGFVAPGNGSVPYDSFMLIPIIARLFIAFICQKLVGNSLLASILTLIVSIISIMIPNIIRRINQCSSKSLDGNQTSKVIIDSILELGCGEIFSSLLSFVPFVGIIFRIIEIIPILGNLVSAVKWSFGFILAYIITNMFDQVNMNTLCQPSGINSSDIAKIIIGILFTMIGSMMSVIKG